MKYLLHFKAFISIKSNQFTFINYFNTTNLSTNSGTYNTYKRPGLLKARRNICYVYLYNFVGT